MSSTGLDQPKQSGLKDQITKFFQGVPLPSNNTAAEKKKLVKMETVDLLGNLSPAHSSVSSDLEPPKTYVPEQIF